MDQIPSLEELKNRRKKFLEDAEKEYKQIFDGFFEAEIKNAIKEGIENYSNFYIKNGNFRTKKIRYIIKDFKKKFTSCFSSEDIKDKDIMITMSNFISGYHLEEKYPYLVFEEALNTYEIKVSLPSQWLE
jgi:hypothetical protein